MRSWGNYVRLWGGRAHPDRLLSYPDVCYLSGCVAAWAHWSPGGLGWPRALLAASGAAISHVIPLRMFLVLKWDRWYSAVFELLVNEVLGELRATFRGHSAVPGSFACNSP